MKKVFLMVAAIMASLSMVSAQNPLEFFPNEAGTVLVSKSYTAEGGLIGTTTYRVIESYEYPGASNLNIGFVMQDASNNVVDQGTISAMYDGDDFYLSMNNSTIVPDMEKYLAMDTELISDFLDYPNVFGGPWPFDDYFNTTEGELIIRSKEDKKDFIRMRVYNREYVETENVNTPAGIFNAAKITYSVELYNSDEKRSMDYNGKEWYAPGAGVVRSEIYDNDGKMISYTELTTLQAPEK